MAEPNNSWPQLWITVAVLAHIYSAVFLLRTLALAHPGRLRAWVKWLLTQLRCRAALQHPVPDPTDEQPQPAANSGQQDQEQQGQQPDLDLEVAAPLPTSAIQALGAVGASRAPSSPATLQWLDVGCTYNTAQGPRVVLQGAYASAGPGDMMALLGPSGSGKTTLLDILALRKTVGAVTGSLLLNGKPFSRETSGHLSTYVPQEEAFPPSLTCEEVLTYWSNLALPAGLSKAQRAQRIVEVLGAVGLQNQSGTLVGGALPGGLVLRGLSGGERKRLSVAAGLLKRPPLVFLDEPTTGLDGQSALSVMKHLASMAAAGHTIIASIHQPRGAVWSLFTKVVVLSGGFMIYSGPRQQLVPWLTGSLGYGPYCPQSHGVAADWVIDLVNIGFRKPQKYFGRTMTSGEDLRSAASRFLDGHLDGFLLKSRPGGGEGSSTPSSQAALAAPPGAEDGPGSGPDQANDDGGGGSSTWLQQVLTLCWREMLLITRNPADVAGHCLLFCWVALVVGLIFFSRGQDLADISSFSHALFVEVCCYMLLPYIYMSLYTSDKRFFVADSAAGLYHPSAYHLAKAIVGLPFAVVNILTLSLVIYGMIGLQHGLETANWGPPIIEHVVVNLLGYLLSCQVLSFAALATASQDAAFMVAIAWTAVNMLLSNVLIRFDTMTVHWVSWLRYVSAMWYTMNGLIRAQFAQKQFSCADGLASERVTTQLIPELLPNMQALKSGAVQRMILHPGPCAVDGEQVIEFLGSTMASWTICLCLAAYLLVLHALSYAALLSTQRREKR